MDRQKFLNAFHKSSSQLDKRKIRKTIRKNTDANSNSGELRGKHLLIVVMEECAELIQAISKLCRAKQTDKYNLLEEMADVQICIWYLQEIYDIETNDLYKAINVKIDRLNNTIKEKGVYK